MKLAVIGGGVSGLVAALRSQQSGHDVTLFEAQSRLGGHTDTHRFETESGTVNVDSGFIVMNRDHYPRFSRLLDELGVDTRQSDMSFSVRDDVAGMEYALGDDCPLYRQPGVLLRPRFWRILRDLIRFYRQAPSALALADEVTVGSYLDAYGYSDAFAESHLLPMIEALWSADPKRLRSLPIRHVIAFFSNHQMLTLSKRSPWETVVGGSSTYVEKVKDVLGDAIQLNTPVLRLARVGHKVSVESGLGQQSFDRVFLACHSDQALKLISDADRLEHEVLSAIGFQPNEALVHTDASVMPLRRSSWASWNVIRDGSPRPDCSVTYWMNRLQGLSCDTQFFVSLNLSDKVDPSKVLARRQYDHPIFDIAAVNAQRSLGDIQGHRNLYYCGAYWGWGFHEDGARSGELAVEHLNRAGKGQPRAA